MVVGPDVPDFSHRDCANCGNPLVGDYCHNCGQKTIQHRFTTPVLLRGLAGYLTDIEQGFAHTVVSLFRRPGDVIVEYWGGRTVAYYAPFRYFFIWTAVLLLTNFWLGIDDVLQRVLEPDELAARTGAQVLAAADQQFDQWLKLLVLVQVPIHSASSFLLFRKHRRTYGEHLILNSFVMGQLALIAIVAQLLVLVSCNFVVPFLLFSLILGVTFYTATLRRVFNEPIRTVVVKATIQSVVGIAVYGALVAAASAVAIALNS